MQKRELSQLAVYQIQEGIEVLSVQRLRNLYLEKTSEIVYVTKRRNLYGIISIEDVFRTKGDILPVNKNYTVLRGFDIIKAHEIFNAKKNIHKLPVINEIGNLIGDYSRWDDELYLERCQRQIEGRMDIKTRTDACSVVYVVEPIEQKQRFFKWILMCLEERQIEYQIITKKEIRRKLYENTKFVFADEDEKRGCECLLKTEIDSTISLENINKARNRFITYKNLISEMLQETDFEKYKISNYSPNNVDEKATCLLGELEKNGIKSFCFYLNEDKQTEYEKIFYKNIWNRLNIKNEDIDKKEFYGELYEIGDYAEEKAQKEIEEDRFIFEYKKNVEGRYFNAKEGRRITCFQPQKYIGTIYLLGPCTVIGGYVEDQYTIASYLQKSLLEKGYEYRVENYGSMLRVDSSIDVKLEDIGQYQKNDIVIYLSRVGKVIGMQGESLEKIFASHQIPSEWVTDDYTHCNDKANKIIADSVMKVIETSLSCKREKCIKVDIHNVMKEFVYEKYIETKPDLFHIKNKIIGSIVMNCNPFTKGHRYLIDESRKKVDTLIVFVVEEDISLFTFEERFWLVKEGTKDLDNVIVIPSGEFILSENNFNEYFTKQDNEVAKLNSEYDINVFADYIAKPLHISYRFAGEEPNDRLTSIYNETMKRILPDKGIQFDEFPRITIDDEVVSASAVRKYLEQKEYKKAFKLLPETTRRYFEQQCGFLNVDI